MAKCPRVSNNNKPYFGSCPCNIQPPGILHEAQVALHIASYSRENDDVTLTALKPVDCADCYAEILRDRLLE